ncbi:MAG: glycosyltransferase family 2 protein [Acidobacteriia bacterium]|nr:glycosyltransferase family 2 protein [Terriglobia bacterium]
MTPELGIVLPAFNERGNVEPVLDALRASLHGIFYEVILVDDDSEDGTADLARSLSARYPELRVIQRINRYGLASACIEGMMASHAPYLAVMDCDLQHDEKILPQMLERLKTEKLDIVIGTRHAEGGSTGDFAASRRAISDTGRLLSRAIYRENISDPMSGFFVLDRRFLLQVVRTLSGTGYKILLDLLASAPQPVRFGEVGYTFRSRVHGSSKLDLLVSLEYLELLLDKLMGNYVPPRFVLFGMVGLVGLVLNLVLFDLLSEGLGLTLPVALAISGVVVMTANYWMNNQFTFRKFRLRGWGLLKGLGVFYLACSIGLFANVELATALRQSGFNQAAAVLTGVAVGSLWNYFMSSMLVWQIQRRRRRLAY